MFYNTYVIRAGEDFVFVIPTNKKNGSEVNNHVFAHERKFICLL